MAYRAVFAAIASPVAPVSPVNYIADQGAHWSTSSTTIGRARLVPKTYLMEGISGVSGLVASAQFQGASAFFTLPVEIATPGLIIKGPPSLPHKIFVGGVESNIAVAGATVEIRANQKSDITQSEYPITVGLNTVVVYADTTPNAFTISDMVGCAIGEEHTTETITPEGFDNAVVSGTEYALINGIRAKLPTTIIEGSTLAFIFTQTQVDQQNTVSIGNVSYTFASSKNKPAVLTPISMFHIAYARSGVTYTSGLIRNDTGIEVDISVVNGTIVGNKLVLADQETCELEFTVPAGTGHHTVTLFSGATSIKWHVWKDAAYLDPWSAVSGAPGVKIDSAPLSFASLPKPAKMDLYLPSGVNAKINGVDINPDETYSGLDASSTELEITTHDEVIISGYPNFAPKRVRVGSVYATWLLFPADGDPDGDVPYYAQAYLQGSVPIRLNSVSYSILQKGSASVSQESSASLVGGMPLVSKQVSYLETLAPLLATDSSAVIPDLAPVFIAHNAQPCSEPNPVHRKQNSTDVTAASPVYIEHYLDRPDLGVFEYRHQNCEVVDAADGEYVRHNLTRPEASVPSYVDAQQLFELAALPAKIDTAYIKATASSAMHEVRDAYATLMWSPHPHQQEVGHVKRAEFVLRTNDNHVLPIDAANYSANFAGSLPTALIMSTTDYTCASVASNKGAVYSHIGGSLEINFVEAAVAYHMPMVSTSKPYSQHSINLVSHWQRPDYYCIEGIPLLVNLVTYTSSNDVMYKSDSGYVSSTTPSVGTQVTHVIDSTARNNSDAHNVFVKEALYKQEHYSTVQSRTKLISLVHNSVASVAINSYQVAHSVELRALFTHKQNSVDVGLSALRTQDVHSIYMPDFTLFESFYVDESQLDLPHGYFQTDLAALSNGMHVWRKQPYEIAPYELQDNVWVWITPVYGFDLCSDVPMYGYIRGG